MISLRSEWPFIIIILCGRRQEDRQWGLGLWVLLGGNYGRRGGGWGGHLCIAMAIATHHRDLRRAEYLYSYTVILTRLLLLLLF